MGKQLDDSLSPRVWPGGLELVPLGKDTHFKGVRVVYVVDFLFKFEKPAAKWTKIVLLASLYLRPRGLRSIALTWSHSVLAYTHLSPPGAPGSWKEFKKCFKETHEEA